MNPSPNPTNNDDDDRPGLPPWGRDERDIPEGLAERIARIKERIRLIRERRD